MILIAGAGIGGLTLGRALARARLPFRIYERASDLRPAGAGIALSANAFTALAHVGLEEPARACGRELGVAAICHPAGHALISVRVRDIVAGGTVAMARSDLQRVLLESIEGSVQTGRAVARYENVPGGVRVHLADGGAIDADLLVAADGLHSAVRRQMRGAETLRYSGQTSWRALVDGIDLAEPDRLTETWGAGRRFGIVPIGARRVYWFAVRDSPAGGRDGDDACVALRALFAGWHAPIEDMIAATPADQIVRTDIFDRPPIDRWVEGRVALLGDAAHPMTPDAGMGGCQAIEDAVVLADALAREATVDGALIRYQARRVARANGFVVRSHRIGQIAHLRTAPLRWLRNTALRAVPVRLAARALARDLGFRL
jgi:2-polyprenyl-6-methoxyphenol hydroxylase-like FAD-dependent oxidoreductase